ncbi:MAG: NifB/NifX family molybdenum-iron cluster-binding protein [Spirochaetales bacterium]|nr:NifB/NifX family molybdenum-iron cluster-binding protein [Spirochaetales bacterium]
MIVALCSTGFDDQAELDSRFGRCSHFLFFDTDQRTFKTVSNSAKDASGGAGAQAVQILVNFGTGVLIAPDVGPQAMDALQAMNISVFRQGSITLPDKAIKAWENHRLEEQQKASVAGMHRA